MAGSDDWQRDQADREKGMMGIVTGSAANQQALIYADQQRKITQSINDNLYNSFKTRSVAAPPVHGGVAPIRSGGLSPSGPISTAPLILFLVGISGAVTFLFTWSSLSTGLVSGACAVALFGLRAIFRIEAVQRLANALLQLLVMTVFYGGIALLALLFLAWIAVMFYAVWWMAGPSVTIWVAAGALGLLTLLWGIDRIDNRYRKFAQTPHGKRFVRRIGFAKSMVKLGILGFAIWWAARALELV
jgi:hypothetical protein